MLTRVFRRCVARSTAAVAALALAPAATAQDAASGFDAQLDIMTRAVAAETAGRADDEVNDGSSLSIRVTPSLSYGDDKVLLTFSNATSRIEYFADDRADRWQNVARLAVEFGANSATSLRISGERSDNIITAEAPEVDEWEIGGRLQHALDGSNRLQFGAAWRDRHYGDANRTGGSGPRVDAEYRYRFSANHFAYLRGRYDSIASADPRRDTSRWTAAAAYQRPLAQDLLLRSGVSWSRLEFPGRTLATGGFRRDTVLSPEIGLSYTPGAWRFAVDARYIARQSTDPAFDRSGYRFALEVSHDF